MTYVIIRHLCAFFGAFLFAFYLIPIVIEAAMRRHIFDVPDGQLKIHKNPTPYLGGVGVYLSLITTLALIYPPQSEVLWLFLGTTILLFVGLIDDFIPFKPIKKLAGQVVAVVCFLHAGILIRTNFFADIINIAASGFWMLSVINAFNLVDVMDGLSTLLAIISAIAFFVIALVLEKYLLSLLLVAFIGALLGFFWYNRPPAKIYLGDAGSLFIGGFLAAVPLLFPWTELLYQFKACPEFVQKNSFWEIPVAAVVPILIVGLPLIEIISLIIIRRIKGIPFYNGSPHHFSSYLRHKGWSVPQTLFFTGKMGTFLAVLACMFLFGWLPFWGLLLGLGLFSVFWIYFIFG